MPERDGLTPLVIRIPTELRDDLRDLAAELDISMAQAIRAAIRRWVNDPSLEQVRPASNRGPCTCHQFTRGPGDTERTLNPTCPQHAVVVG